MRFHQYINTIVGTALLLAMTSAAAQYVWADEKGTRNYSDRPPPPGTPPAKILKAPHGMQQIMEVASPPAPAAVVAANAAPAATPAQALAARDEDFHKRRKESAEKVKKDEEAAHVAATNKQNCESLRTTKSRLESGERIQAPGAADPHEVMGDLQRSAALAKANRDLASCLSQ